MRKIKNMWIIIVILLFGALISTAARAEKRIGILTFSPLARYLEAKRGFLDILKEAGFQEPQTEFITEDADADKALAAAVVNKFVTSKFDLILTVGTHATLAILQEVKDVPIVFTTVYDPVETGIAKDWKNSGNNTTGASTKVPMCKLLDMLKQFLPVKSLAVLYTSGEKNSESQLKDLQVIQANYGIKVVPVPLSKLEEITQLLPIVMRTSDALYITGSNFVNSHISLIVEMATKEKIVTITHLIDLVEKGVLLGMGADNYLLGRLAGKKAIRILKGEPPSAIPIETLEQFDVIINLKTAKAGGFQIPPDFMKMITKPIQ